MVEPWNNSFLLPPPVHTSRTDCNVDTMGLRHTCKNIIKILTKQSPLHKEGAIVSRFMYKYDKKFRNDIGYRHFRKVNTALRRYLALNVLKDMENFALALPSGNEDYLPTRQMLEYVLVRLMTFSKIMLRICVCSKQASVFYLDRVKRGESHWMCLMPYALLCRVWSMSLVLLQHSTQWYSSLHQYLNKLLSKGLEFLPENYKLPTDLEEWLDMKNIDNFGRLEWSQKKHVAIDLTLDDEGEMFDNILGFVNQINEDSEQDMEYTTLSDPNKGNEQLHVPMEIENDQGVRISRESFNILRNFQKKIDIDIGYKHYFERVTDVNSLQQFIDKEETFRNESNELSLTSHLSFMQWQVLKNSLLNLCNPLFINRKIERKCKKIWKEKCLDYV